MKISKKHLRQIIREEQQKLIREARKGAHAKLHAAASGDPRNLDQEVYFGLEAGVKELVAEFANDPRYTEYGVTSMDVLLELQNVVKALLDFPGNLK